MKDNVNVNWSSILAGMFTDPRFRKFERWCWGAKIEGMSVGVVIATLNPGYDTFALNKPDTERLLAAKRDGQIDEAFVVAASIYALNNHIYCDFKYAEPFYEEVLKNLRPRLGQYGEFWTLPLSQFATTGIADQYVRF
jgi:hypothetical protein